MNGPAHCSLQQNNPKLSTLIKSHLSFPRLIHEKELQTKIENISSAHT
jgi:hypothetical protein